jgi:ketosteroid isomerase-like protein
MKQSVEQQVRQFWNLFNADKLEMLVELYAPDGRLLPPGQQVIIGKPGVTHSYNYDTIYKQIVQA